MTGKRYSAGAIFLQVVPVFANVQNLIEKQAQDINRALGDEMERGGEKAGERAGKAASKKMADEFRKGSVDMERDFKKSVENMGNALDDIDMRALKTHVKREVAAIKQELASIHDVDLTVDANFKKAYAEIEVLNKRLAAVDNDIPIVFHANLDAMRDDIKRAKAMLASIDTTIEIDADMKPAERAIGAFERAIKKSADKAGAHLSGTMRKNVQKVKENLDELKDKRIGIDISGNMARAELERMAAELRQIAENDIDIQVRTDATAALAELMRVLAVMKKLDTDDVNIDVNANTATADAKLVATGAAARKAGTDGETAANSFRSFNAILFAAATGGPALIPVLGAIAGGLLAIGPAAAVAAFGLGAVLVGFSGIGDALTALGNQQDQAAMTAQTAGRSEAASAKQVANARRSAARQIESALDRQRDAQKRYQKSIKDVQEAEQALRDAREAAKNNGADIDRAVRENKLAIDQALLDSFSATVEFDAVMADGSSSNADKEQARINREEALLRLEELRAQQKELAAEQKKWNEEGVNGTDEVQQAQDRLKDAIESQKEAYEALGDAARGVDEARADGARAVSDALAAQQDALAGVNAQQNAVNAAFEKLGPAGQKFALFLFGLREGFRRFRDDIQEVMLPSIQEAIEGFLGSRTAGIARTGLIALAAQFGEFVKALSVSFQGEAWTEFFTMLGSVGPQIQEAWGSAFISLLEALASILTVTAPFALKFAEGLAKMMDQFANWAASEEGQNSILDFLGYVERIAPAVIDFVGSLARAVADLAVALAPWGELVLETITDFLEFISDMDPETLAAVATAVVLLAGAAQTAYLVMNAINAGAALLLNPIGLTVFALLAIGGALAYLYLKNEDFADFIDDAWDRISKAVMGAWEDFLKPALKDLGKAFENLWKEILEPFFDWLGPALAWYIEHALPVLIAWWSFLAEAIAFAINYYIIPAIKVWWAVWSPVLTFIGRRLKWLWEKVIEPFVEWVKREWPKWAVTIRTVWDEKLKPVFDKMGRGLDALKEAFRATVKGIRTIWGNLGSIISAPVKFVVNTVLRDGLIKGINKVLKFVNRDPIDFPGIVEKGDASGVAGAAGADVSRATGGILPGYTPGRDVHHFESPTAGRLHLSGGEAIMRPEWTQAVGPGWVNQMNALARKGGAKAVQAAMMGRAFAKGGVFWPLPGSTASTYRGHDGVDLNAPNDEGKPFFSATSGKVSTTGYGRGYGNAVFVVSPYGELVYGHAQDGSIGVRAGQAVKAGQFLARVGSTGNSSGPHLHFGFPGGTYAGALGLLSGAGQIPASEIKKAGKAGGGFPRWAVNLAKDPLGYVKGLVQGPIDKFKNKFASNDLVKGLTAIPGKLITGVKDRLWDILPGPLKKAVEGAGKVVEGAGKVVEGAKSAGDKVGDGLNAITPGDAFKNGGILPYNGTMMYDNGGYLPPGLTSVMNLTGKPEPVFTDGQFKKMGRGDDSGTIHYEPHFEGSDLTAEDVAADLNFQFRKIRRRGKYAGVGDQ